LVVLRLCSESFDCELDFMVIFEFNWRSEFYGSAKIEDLREVFMARWEGKLELELIVEWIELSCWEGMVEWISDLMGRWETLELLMKLEVEIWETSKKLDEIQVRWGQKHRSSASNMRRSQNTFKDHKQRPKSSVVRAIRLASISRIYINLNSPSHKTICITSKTSSNFPFTFPSRSSLHSKSLSRL
jgi:hypothetical protein